MPSSDQPKYLHGQSERQTIKKDAFVNRRMHFLFNLTAWTGKNSYSKHHLHLRAW
jgi:hypothetical protein